MKIFITGGTGFIGKYVTEKLVKEKHEVLLLSRKKGESQPFLNFVEGDLGNINKWWTKVSRFKPDVAIHLGWEGLPSHEYSLSRKNFLNSLNLIEMLADINCRKIISTGSCWEYGLQTGKINENTPLLPFDSFTAAKHSLYWFGREIAKNKSVDFIWTRPFYVYGPGQHPKSLIPYLIESARNNIPPEIRNPDARNDFIFVEDLAEAYTQLLLGNLKHDLYNIGSGKLTNISEIIKIIFKEFGLKTKFKKAKTDNRDKLKEFYADISRIKKDTPWRPRYSIASGIKKMINSPRV